MLFDEPEQFFGLEGFGKAAYNPELFEGFFGFGIEVGRDDDERCRSVWAVFGNERFDDAQPVEGGHVEVHGDEVERLCPGDRQGRVAIADQARFEIGKTQDLADGFSNRFLILDDEGAFQRIFS